MLFLSSSLEKQTGANWAGVTGQSTLTYLLDFKNVSYKTTNTGEQSFVVFNVDYFKVWLQAMTWDFDFFTANPAGEMVRWIFFIPMSIAVMASIGYGIMTLLQGFIP